jgi:hypothetical protein
MFLHLTRPFDSREIFDVRHSAGAFLEKACRITQKVPFNALFGGRLQAMEIRVILDVPDDSDEKVRINHANYLEICHANEFMSLLKVCQLNQCTT